MILIPLAVPSFSLCDGISLLWKGKISCSNRMSVWVDMIPLCFKVFWTNGKVTSNLICILCQTLSVLSSNVRGLHIRIGELFMLSLSFNFDFIILSEVGSFDSISLCQLFQKCHIPGRGLRSPYTAANYRKRAIFLHVRSLFLVIHGSVLRSNFSVSYTEKYDKSRT